MADPEDDAMQRLSAAGPPPANPSTASVLPEMTEEAGAVTLRPQELLARSIVRTKVQPPPVRSSTLERTRLLDWLNGHGDSRLILVTGEAGYGKTTLLADFARRTDIRCVWYRLEPTDGDWITFINYVIAAIREVLPDFGSAAAGLLAQISTMPVRLDTVLEALLAELPSIGRPQTALILDDFHAVDDSRDVQLILSRLIERSPQNLTFIVASRVAPTMKLARLAAHGQVSRLETEDLRFSAEETSDLFSVAYQLPLEPDLLHEIDARAEGWAASLQLVYSSIRERRPSDARAFINSLSGAEGPLYDYLAEEVLGGLRPALQRVLVRASLLERVVPAYVVAILAAEPEPLGTTHVTTLLDEADGLGLMGRAAAGSTTRRFHPLLRTYLEHQLELETSAAERQAMHLRIAAEAEEDDWLTAANHYIHGGRSNEAMRVIEDSATSAFGNGDFGGVSALLARMPEIRRPLAVEAVRARALLASDGERAALELLDSLDMSNATNEEWTYVTFAKASTYFAMSDLARCREAVRDLIDKSEAPSTIKDIATSWHHILSIGQSVTLQRASRELVALGERQAAAGHHYHAGITFHNAMTYTLTAGDYSGAVGAGTRAHSAFKASSAGGRELPSTLATLAVCLFEQGYADRALALAAEVMDLRNGHPDAYGDVALLRIAVGQFQEADIALDRARESLRTMQGDPAAKFSLGNTAALLALARGELDEAEEQVSADTEVNGPDPDVGIRRHMIRALIAVSRGRPGAAAVANDALRLGERLDSGRYIARLRLIVALARGDSTAITKSIHTAATSGGLALLDAADGIVCALPASAEVPIALHEAISAWPDRWLPSLRNQLTLGNVPSAHASARLLARHGYDSDVPRVVAFERTYVKSARARTLGSELISRTSPRLIVHDLGRMQYELAGHLRPLTQTRRKAASLLTFLITRPNRTATKEQVIEQLWPELDAVSAINSFNQTLYFLRRDLDHWYDVATSPEYIVNESEIVWLDSSLVALDSVLFHESALSMREESLSLDGPSLCSSYVGRFAPEFEYDEWAMGWRERVHAVYLNLVHATMSSLAKAGRLSQALSVVLEAAAVDPESIDLEPGVIWLYGKLGSIGAAVEQYRRFAGAHRSELGVEPPPFNSVLETDPT